MAEEARKLHPVAPEPGNVIEIHAPATGELIGTVPVTGETEVRDAIRRAREAQKRWAQVAIEERCRRMIVFRNHLMQHQQEVCELISREQGKTLFEALMLEFIPINDLISFFARRAPRMLAPERIPLHLMKQKVSYLHFEPLGVIGIIGPWNFPLSIPLGDAIMALIAGDAVVIKPSEMTPLIMEKVKQIVVASNAFDPELLQLVHGRAQTGSALIDSGVNKIVFTGSTKTGRLVAKMCGERLIPCTLELGGKAPAIVCRDADTERAARGLVYGAFTNSGQVCASVERVYVVESLYEPIVRRVVELTKELRQGDGLTNEVDVGAITFPPGIERMERLVQQAVDKGAKLETGGKRRTDTKGLFFEPTVLSGCNHDMEIMYTETFGPIMPIMKVADENEAIERANDSEMGLLGYVFSDDHGRARRIAERIECGTVMINDVFATHAMPETPWHGLKQSGIGMIHSEAGLKALCQVRHVNDNIANLMQKEFWWYPTSPAMHAKLSKTFGKLFDGGFWSKVLNGF